MVSQRYAEANNKYMEDYKPDEKDSYLMYLDANNLYGWAMIQSLPKGNYKWITPVNFTQEKIMKYSEDDPHGYILEVDLEYPTELHDLHNDYPLAPESTTFTSSPFMQEIMKELNTKPGKTNKLILNLNNKRKYVIHIRNLQQYINLGMKLTKIHRIIRFDQSKWLKEYIKTR